jgi:hypothetical protein
MACMFGTPAAISMSDVKAPLPTVAPDSRPAQPLFAQTMAVLLEKGTILQPLDDIGFSCIAYAMYR